MDQRKLVAIAILGVLLGLGLWGWSSRPAPALLAKTERVSTEVRSSRPSHAVSLDKTPPVRNPLPLAGTALAELFVPLKQRADQGDALAACRLAVELIECRNVDSLAIHATETPDQESSAEAAESLDRMRLRQLALVQQCKGVDARQYALAGKYLALAADAGINEAMVRYADGQGFNRPNQFFGMLQDPGFDAWRRDAPNLLYRALRQGEPSAVFLLMAAYSDDNSPLAGLIANDPVQYFSYRLLIARLRGRNDVPKSNLQPEQLTQARQNAEQMHREYFGGRLLEGPHVFNTALQPSWLRPETDGPRSPCE